MKNAEHTTTIAAMIAKRVSAHHAGCNPWPRRLSSTG
jgi:hypothetical protein